jgi:curli biogenesis system outer membrane secretion channel CsgG
VAIWAALVACAAPPVLGQRNKAMPVDLPPGARVAVVAMNSSGGSQVDTVVGDMLTSAFRSMGLRVLERQELDAILREHSLGRSADVDPATVVTPGKIVGAEYLVGAKATEFGIRDTRHGGLFGLGPFGGVQIRTSTARVVLDARILDVRTGEVLATATGEGKIVNYGGTLLGGSWVGGSISLGGVDVNSKEWSESLLGRAARKAVDDVIKRLIGGTPGSSGRVLAVADDGAIIISLGQKDGLRTGDRVQVVEVSQIRDRAGEPVWSEESVVGMLRIIEVRMDRSKAEVLEGKRPEEQMLVRKAPRSARPSDRT